MNYNPLIDLTILGAALLVLAAIIHKTNKPRRGAEYVGRKEVLRHQAVRRVLMGEGGYH